MAHLTINYKSSALNMPIMLDVLIPNGRSSSIINVSNPI